MGHPGPAGCHHEPTSAWLCFRFLWRNEPGARGSAFVCRRLPPVLFTVVVTISLRVGFCLAPRSKLPTAKAPFTYYVVAVSELLGKRSCI